MNKKTKLHAQTVTAAGAVRAPGFHKTAVGLRPLCCFLTPHFVGCWNCFAIPLSQPPKRQLPVTLGDIPRWCVKQLTNEFIHSILLIIGGNLKKKITVYCFIMFLFLHFSCRNKNIDEIRVDNPERIKISFHIVDEEATNDFNNFYIENPSLAFNNLGELVDHSIVPNDVIVKSVFDLNLQSLNTIGNFEFVAIKKEVGISGKHITEVQINRDWFDPSRAIITVTFDSEGGEIFYKLTSENVGKPMAIVLDNQIKSIAIIRTAIKELVSIQGFSVEEANILAISLGSKTLLSVEKLK